MHLKSLNLRLALTFIILVTLFTVTMFVVSYSLLSSTSRGEEEREAQARLLEFWVMYQEGGVETDGLFPLYVEGRENYLMRLSWVGGETRAFYAPAFWRGLEAAQLERRELVRQALIRSPIDGRLVAVYPLRLDDRTLFEIGLDATDRIESMHRYRRIFILTAVPLTALGIVGGLFYSRRALRPVGALIGAIRSVLATGVMSHRIEPPGSGDELDQLVTIFNQLLERIESLVTGMREALDNTAHDLRTPITRLRNQAELALAADPGDAREAMGNVIRQSEILLSMLESLMDVAEAERGTLSLEKEPLDLAAVVKDIGELYTYAAEAKGVQIEIREQRPISVQADRGRVQQILANLLDNAVKYTERGGRVEVSAEPGESEVVIVVADTGCGIAESDLPHIWNRLYRGDPSRGEPGLGLGLSLVRAYAVAHGGRVEVSSRVGGGSRFSVHLPRENAGDTQFG